MEILIKEMPIEDANKLGIQNWPTWGCDESKFDWIYSDTETSYIFEGHVEITAYGKLYDVRAGMIVQFPRGMACVWEVKAAINKAYTFEPITF